MTADPGSPAQASAPDPFSGIFTPEAKSMAAIAEARQQSPTPAVAAPRLEVFDQPDVQTPGGTYIWSEGSSTPTPVKAAARERIPKKSPFKVDFDGNVPYSASRPFQVDFVSNLPAGANAGSVWPEQLEINPNGEAHPNRVQSEVVEVIYFGDHNSLRLAVAGRDDIIAKVSAIDSGDKISPGDSVEVGWALHHCRALDPL